jgi:hypothetical protein
MMRKRVSYVLIGLIVLLLAALILGGGQWLWHLFLRMHGRG